MHRNATSGAAPANEVLVGEVIADEAEKSVVMVIAK
jgi:hypothetical protein